MVDYSLICRWHNLIDVFCGGRLLWNSSRVELILCGTRLVSLLSKRDGLSVVTIGQTPVVGSLADTGDSQTNVSLYTGVFPPRRSSRRVMIAVIDTHPICSSISIGWRGDLLSCNWSITALSCRCLEVRWLVQGRCLSHGNVTYQSVLQ